MLTVCMRRDTRLMDCCCLLQEVLRMYPPVGIGQIRVAEKHDIVLGGQLHIPAGTIMWVSPFYPDWMRL